MDSNQEIKAQVQAFYDSVGWRQVSEGLFQNARYEDLRPVSRKYIHLCHLRVNRHLESVGVYLLDGGSGPIQYPEYLTYSEGYRYRVCLDLSRVALEAARDRIGGHGLYVVGDISRLPFRGDSFDGLVSLHTVHHLPAEDHLRAYREFARVLVPGKPGVVVNSWGEHSALMRLVDPLIQLAFGMVRAYRRLSGVEDRWTDPQSGNEGQVREDDPTGSYVHRVSYGWLKGKMGFMPGFKIRVWRSVSTSFLRAFIHRRLLGSFWLKGLYRLEEMAPRLLGILGQYPMIIFRGVPGSSPKGNEEAYELER